MSDVKWIVVALMLAAAPRASVQSSGWSIGTKDYGGKLRAERTARGNRRIYTLTYRVTDRAGNEALATALVVVPGLRD